MSLWEYKVISSGRGGFATPVLLEKFLNDLGREQWEIVEFRTHPDNPLAFSGLARRPTQRDWTLEDAAAAAAKAEAEKLRVEFEAKFREASGGGATEERGSSFLEEKVAPDDGFRKPVDTSHDADPDVDEEEAKADEWDKLSSLEDEDLPTFFEAIKPYMRRNQRGPGMSVGLEYLARKWDQSEDDLKGALAECGFVVPEDEDAKPHYLEYDGDLYWLNVNRRGELWINTKEKPRAVFRTIKAQRANVEEEPARSEPAAKTEAAEPKPAAAEKTASPAAAAGRERTTEETGEEAAGRQGKVALPEGPALLERIRPLMRRNRRGPGASGSASFLSRALKCREADLAAAFKASGLTIPGSPADKPVLVDIGNQLWWLNLDSRGGLWINGREKKPGETLAPAAPEQPAADAPTEAAPAGSSEPAARSEENAPAAEGAHAAPAEQITEAVHSAADAPPAEAALPGVEIQPVEPPADAERPDNGTVESVMEATTSAPPESRAGTVLAGVRLLLKESRTGSFSSRIERLADEMGKSADEFVATLVSAGLKVPEKPREKPVFVEHAGEVFWFNKNMRGELWLNAKTSKFAADKHATDPAAEAGEEGEAERGEDEERRPRRSRSRKKPGESGPSAPAESEVSSEATTPAEGGAV
jgi:hypothetical protein